MKKLFRIILLVVVFTSSLVYGNNSIAGLLHKLENAGLVHNAEYIDQTHIVFYYKGSKGHIYDRFANSKEANKKIEEIYSFNDDKTNPYIFFGMSGNALLVLPPGVSEKESEKFFKFLD